MSNRSLQSWQNVKCADSITVNRNLNISISSTTLPSACGPTQSAPDSSKLFSRINPSTYFVDLSLKTLNIVDIFLFFFINSTELIRSYQPLYDNRLNHSFHERNDPITNQLAWQGTESIQSIFFFRTKKKQMNRFDSIDSRG